MGGSNCMDVIPARGVLWIMAFLMFLVTQMLRSNLYVAIIAMTANGTQQLHWSEHDKGVVLSAFYWSYWLTELPGGLIAQQFGGRRLLGITVAIAGCLNLVLPQTAKMHYLAAAGVRALQGLVLGVTWPAMHSLSARWIPPTERSRFMTSYQGTSIGSAITYPLTGYIIDFLGWPSVYYVSGGLTILWSLVWWLLIYDDPSKHPRICEKERIMLQKTIFNSAKISTWKTPWKGIVMSLPFWSVLVASLGVMWGTITLSMQIPSYFDNVHHLDIKMNGFLSGIPDVCKFLFGLLFSFIMDSMLKKNQLDITTVRKISVGVCQFIPACLLLTLAYFGSYSTEISVALLVLSVTAGGATSSGSLANIVDLSPNFAGTLIGLIKTLTFIPGILSPMAVSLFTNENKHINWPNIFITTSSIYAVCGTFFILFASGEVQPWNDTQQKKNFEEEKMVYSDMLERIPDQKAH